MFSISSGLMSFKRLGVPAPLDAAGSGVLDPNAVDEVDRVVAARSRRLSANTDPARGARHGGGNDLHACRLRREHLAHRPDRDALDPFRGVDRFDRVSELHFPLGSPWPV